MKEQKILITGACGQLGRELTMLLKAKYGKKAIVATDKLEVVKAKIVGVKYCRVDVTNKAQLQFVIQEEKITQIFHLAAMWSTIGEIDPVVGWQVNMEGLLNVLELSVRFQVEKVFWPSSTAVFGPDTPKMNTNQNAFTVPTTAYGISKLSGEYWCRYYFEKFGLDVRSLRYPGLIYYKSVPDGGTTDYAVDIFYKAKAGQEYICFLREDTPLPMMHMADAVRATLELMDAPLESISVRSGYNLSALSFTPADLASEIRKIDPEFKITYEPDFRQAIADSYPVVINDRLAREDWGWRHSFSLSDIVEEMMENVEVEEQTFTFN